MRGYLANRVLPRLFDWHTKVERKRAETQLCRSAHPILIFCHGYSLAHTLRPLVLARSLRERSYPVELAGIGPHIHRITEEGFHVHPVETMPQSRMDEYVGRSDYRYYNHEWIDRCVKAERALIQKRKPALVLGDMRPTLRLSAAFEGIDLGLLESAYNQPGYPFPLVLPESFPLSIGPFDAYLRRHDEEVKPHRTFYFMADIPEFHPPGPQPSPHYHYVGPLLDIPSTPEAETPLEETDGDTSRPLIYMNCGSTGHEPGYLATLLEVFAQSPYRFLITTAGRISLASPSPHICIRDFVPAEWAMQRADLFIGIGGIGTVYHALKQGIPILGAPEHLDQEYHLNRVKDLGLGVKLNGQDFHRPEKVVEKIQWIFARYHPFKEKCEAFSTYVQAWSNGSVAADIIDRHFVACQATYQIEPQYLVSETEFLHHLRLNTPPDLTQKDLKEIIRQGCKQGLPHQQRDSQLWFDQAYSWNWLYDHAPRFFEADYLASERKRNFFFIQENDGIAPRQSRQRYRLTYRYRAYPHSLPSSVEGWLFLPYPIRTDHQTDIRLCFTEPAGLGEYLLETQGFIYGYPVFLNAEAKMPLDFSYTCEVTVDAHKLKRAPCLQMLSPGQLRRYTDIDPSIRESALIQKFRNNLGLEKDQSDFDKAKRIYSALVESKRFKKTKENSQSLENSARAVLSDNGAHCITLTHTFLALCRLERIPAREVTGALAGYPTSAGKFSMGCYKEMLFGHTWAEFFTEEYGWVPVEFHGVVIGEHAVTQDNLREVQIHKLIQSNHKPYHEFYFGNLDGHRVRCSTSVKNIPQLAIKEEAAHSYPRFSKPSRLSDECHLLMECI